MKPLLIALLLASQLQAEFLQDDKKKHGAVGTAIYYSCVGLGTLYKKHDINWMNRNTCWVANLVVAGLKEAYDKKHGGVADMNDITAQVFVPSVDIVLYEW